MNPVLKPKTRYAVSRCFGIDPVEELKNRSTLRCRIVGWRLTVAKFVAMHRVSRQQVSVIQKPQSCIVTRRFCSELPTINSVCSTCWRPASAVERRCRVSINKSCCPHMQRSLGRGRITRECAALYCPSYSCSPSAYIGITLLRSLLHGWQHMLQRFWPTEKQK